MARRRQCKRQRKDDFISDLTDSVLLHILSFLNAIQAVQTCVLSKRWIILWKSLSTITLRSSYSRPRKRFDEFVSRIFSLRDGSTAIHTLDLYRRHSMKHSLLRKIIEYAVSHNVQHLRIDYTCHIENFPSCLFSCHTLKSLNLSGFLYNTFVHHKPVFRNSLNLPSLTNLSLKYFAFARSDNGCVEPFSTFKMLNSLIIDCCIVLDAQNLCISSTKLVNLSILMWASVPETYIGIYFGIELYAPSLHNFAFTGRYTPKLFGSKSVLSSIKLVSVDLRCRLISESRESSSFLLNWLVELANIESLTFYSNTLEVLSLFPDLLKAELHPLYNLKSLKIETDQTTSICNDVVEFLIQNSPSAKVDIIRL
ncbi:putative F-box domain, leucine-rich repeat domain, L domain-containing protein [Medicago truncatula]|uniref:Cytochrome C biogenesis protein ccsA, putative n=1 Tax=Medicago truncatula TaxID=3880 RepID=G7ZUL0_MEDTR|nr:F-box/LRR-repeat protein At5g02910 [Medicago truncatula]XP_024633132.1 F-box/LRR-repeat protein At5g02910 [Medicago truncatula]KEH39213.1 cytochrome C biogenesis protein ccsA, putative [Medicago truncatula]RHN75791.1 putative F-box domain, leucine-rich repeat domain, L domain-containing protein [Medicago truncatula]